MNKQELSAPSPTTGRLSKQGDAARPCEDVVFRTCIGGRVKKATRLTWSGSRTFGFERKEFRRPQPSGPGADDLKASTQPKFKAGKRPEGFHGQ